MTSDSVFAALTMPEKIRRELPHEHV